MKHKLLSLFALAGMLTAANAAHASGALLALQNLSSPTVYSPGNASSASYTLTIYNNGGIDPAAVLQDVAPAGVTITGWSATTTGCTPASGGTGTLNTSCSVPPKGSVSVAVFAQIAASASGTLTNTATVTPSTGNACAGPGSCSASASISATASGAKLTLSKTASITTYPTGSNTYFTYTLQASNQSSVASTGTQLLDDAPAYIGFVNWHCTDGQTGTGNVRVNGYPLTLIIPANGSVTCTINAVTQTGASGTLTNTATLTPSFQDQCAGPGACTSSASITSTAPVVVPRLSVMKTASIGQYTVGTSTALSYSIVVSNATAAAGTANLTDAVPAGVSFSAWTCPSGSPSSGTGALSSSVSVAGNASATCTVTATIAASSAGAVLNTATISPNSPAQCTVCSSSASVAAVQQGTSAATLAFSNAASIASYVVGSSTPVTYTLRIDNNSATAPQTAQVTDSAPAGLAFNSWTASGCTPSNGSGLVATACAVPANGTLSVVVLATIAATATGNLTNTATLAPGGNDNCAGRPTCAASATVAPSNQTGGPTTISLSSSKNPANPSDNVVFTATIRGNAPTGTVNFTDGSTILCKATVASATATCATATLALGAHVISASYSGDGQNAAASASLTQTIATGSGGTTSSKFTLASSKNPSRVGDAVVFLATAPAAYGSVIRMTVDGTPLCTSVSASVTQSTYSCNAPSTLSSGSHTVSATYAVDLTSTPLYVASFTQVVNAVVSKPATATALTSSVNPTAAGQATELKAVISGSAPTGTVTFADGATPLCSSVAVRTIDSTQLAYCVASFQTVGSHSLTAQYSGDSVNASSISSPFNQTVTAPSAFDADQFGLTGAWYNAPTTGSGFLVEVAEDLNGPGKGLLFMGWFTYDVTAPGGQRWYTLTGNVSKTSASSSMTISEATGGSGNFNAAPIIGTTPIGTAAMTFADCTHATVQYSFHDGSGRSGTIPLTRLSNSTTCSPSGYDGAAATDYLLSGGWYNAPTSGQGILFDIEPSQNTLFAAWYTFAPNGAQIGNASGQRWFTIQGNYTGRAASNIGIYAAAGGVFDDPTPITSTRVGTANLIFSSCSALSLQYTFTAGEFAGQTGTIALTPVAPVQVECQ
jgi:uncharacterized repeat protein (TIGR01451 family)